MVDTAVGTGGEDLPQETAPAQLPQHSSSSSSSSAPSPPLYFLDQHPSQTDVASVEPEPSEECRAAEDEESSEANLFHLPGTALGGAEGADKESELMWGGLVPGPSSFPSSSSSSPTPAFYRWHQVDGGVPPASRGRHTVGIDEERGMLIMFGGQNYDLRQKYADIVRFDLKTDRWVSSSEVSDNESPCARSSHASVATADALYVFGGATGKSFLASPGCCKDASTWRYSFCSDTWTKLQGEGIDAVSCRYGHTTVLTPGNTVYLFGGMTDAGCDWNTYRIDLEAETVEKLDCCFVGSTGDVCGPFPEYALPSMIDIGPDGWSGTSTLGGASSGRPAAAETSAKTAQQVRDCVRGFGHTAIYNPYTHSMYVLGGTVDGRHYHTTFLRLDLNTRRWMLEDSVNSPPEGRYVHCASYDDKRDAMYVFGGYCGSYCNDVHEYDFKTKRWTEIKPHPSSEGPCLRSGACSVVWKDHVYVFGGCDDTQYYNDVWKLRLWNDTISLREAMLDWVAWQQVKGSVETTATTELGSENIAMRLRQKREEYRIVAAWTPRSNKSVARM